MNFRKILLSKGFWVILGASVASAVAIGVVASTAGAAWALVMAVGYLGILLGCIYVTLRTTISKVNSGVSGLRKLAFEQRRLNEGVDDRIISALTEAQATSARSHIGLQKALDLLVANTGESESRILHEFERTRAVTSERYANMDRRIRAVNSQLRELSSGVESVSRDIVQIISSVDPRGNATLAADMHRTLRGTRNLERLISSSSTAVESLCRASGDEARATESLRNDIATQRRLLGEILIATDFRA